jgi:hypothetical protein
MPSRSGATHVIAVLASIDAHRLVVPAEQVEAIGEHRDAERDPGRATDVAALLGLPAPLGPRRALQVRAASITRWLIVGDSVAIRTLPSAAFAVLPRWLDGLHARLPFAGLVAVDGAFAFELDVERMLSGGTP